MEKTQPHRRPRNRQAAAVRRRPQPRGPGHWKRRLTIAGAVVLGLVLVAAVLIWQRASAFNDAVSTEGTLSSRLWGELGGTEPVNVLLIGHSPAMRDGAFLADSLTILSIDPATELTTSVSIPRDLWIEGIADLGRNGKVNEAFAVGHQAGGYTAAGSLTSRIVSMVTGLELAGWIALDFAGFQDMVDAVGGITIENPRTFQWALGPEQHARGEWAGLFPEGRVELNGVDALRYARVRYTDTAAESSDFARGARQQAILSAIRNRVSIDPAGVPRGLALADALEGHLHTDLSVIDLAMLAGHLSPDRRVQLEEGAILEATRNSIGRYVLVVIGRSTPSDYTPLHRYIAEAIAGGSE